MKTASFVTLYTCTILSASFVFGLGLPSHAEDITPYMQPIAGRTAASPAETATKNVLALNTGMFELYDDAAKIFLYRPGMAPLQAPPVPVVYH